MDLTILLVGGMQRACVVLEWILHVHGFARRKRQMVSLTRGRTRKTPRSILGSTILLPDSERRDYQSLRSLHAIYGGCGLG